MAEQYAYFLCEVGLFRVKIPDFELDTASKHKFKIEWVFYNPSKPLPLFMGLFSDGCDVYMAGGQEGDKLEYSHNMEYMYMFKDTNLNLCPLVHHDQLEKPELCDYFEPMAAPCVIRGAEDDKIYFLSEYDFFHVGVGVDLSSSNYKPFRFQSFNPAKNRFKSLPSPPYIVDSGTVPYKALGHFYVGGYIYLFITEIVNSEECVRAFTFNTTLLEWKERKKLVSRFDKRKIPIPRLHSGDVGLFPHDNTHIMVALAYDGKPTAYRVQLCAGGSLRPKSYRILDEVDILDCRGSTANERSHLFDIGGGRFGVIYHSHYVSLQIYVFKIDFVREHYIQISAINGKEAFSSEILSSKKFRDPIPWFNNSRISAVCVAQARKEKKAKKQSRRGCLATLPSGFINFKSMEELAELSQYAYFFCDNGLFRFNIPDFDRVRKFEFEIESVFYDPTSHLPSLPGLFSHHHYIYICGGRDGFRFYRRIYMFDTTKSQQLPIVEHECLDKPEESCLKFEYMAKPYVIQAENRIYFLSMIDTYNNIFSFQSFDPTKNSFKSQPSLHPLSIKCKPSSPLCLFFVQGYLYLFTMEESCCRAFTLNTRSSESEWEERKEFVELFDKNEIPIPHLHRGDVGLSDEFGNNSRILVALHAYVPTAYRVHLGAKGSLSPKSYRVMDEVSFNYCRGSPVYQWPPVYQWSHLLDIGGDKFCLIYQSEDVSLLISVFKMDFALEHAIQMNEAKLSPSSQILSSKRFRDGSIPFFRSSLISAVCLAPVPSNEDPEKSTRESGDNGA